MKILIGLLVFIFFQYSFSASSCRPFFDRHDSRSKMVEHDEFTFPLVTILDVRRVDLENTVEWHILHKSNTGYYLTTANAALETTGGKPVELSKRELKSILEIPMRQRLLRSGFEPYGKYADFYRMVENDQGKIREFFFHVPHNAILSIYRSTNPRTML